MCFVRAHLAHLPVGTLLVLLLLGLGGLEHVPCKVQMGSMWEPRLQEHSPNPTSHKDFVKMSQ